MASKRNPKKIVCTRYAPSPTGHLHVGGARTALFNYLHAKKYNGKFILRIEDTDVDRNLSESHLELENSLKLLNIFPDESFSSPGQFGPYIQSQKLSRYRDICQKLINDGKAYRCFCTEEELKTARLESEAKGESPKYSGKCRRLSKEHLDTFLHIKKPFVVRLKVDIIDTYEWNDLIRGNIKVPSSSMSDFVIMRSNDLPTYNFAVVVDDIDMEITCVLRGEEHNSNTSYQLAVYHALGMSSRIPEFGHLSIIVDENKQKLSKRSGDETHFVSSLVKKGYVPMAIVNFLALLGWSHGETEIFNFEELINFFDLNSISKSPSFFDIKKLNWINHKYFQNMTPEAFWNFVMPIFEVDLGENNRYKKIFALANQKNIYYGAQLNELAVDFYKDRSITGDMKRVLIQSKELIKLAIDNFPDQQEEWEKITIRNYLKQVSQISRLKGKNFYKPLRIAFSKQDEGFELFNVMECLGRNQILKNLRESWELIE